MRPRNFPGRVLRRRAKAVRGRALTTAERDALLAPKDIRIRVGRARRTQEGLIHGR